MSPSASTLPLEATREPMALVVPAAFGAAEKSWRWVMAFFIAVAPTTRAASFRAIARSPMRWRVVLRAEGYGRRTTETVSVGHGVARSGARSALAADPWPGRTVAASPGCG